MIIYASCGLGKTTYCRANPSCFDADYYYYQQSSYKSYYDYVMHAAKKYKIVFINNIEGIDLSLIDQVYLAESIEMMRDRLENRLIGKFVPNQYVFNLERTIFPNAIIVKKDQYLSDFI